MLVHEREGNRWRTTLLPFLPLATARETLMRARSWCVDQATAYLADLAASGVRLPWTLERRTVATCPPTAQSPADADDIGALLDAAQLAHARGDMLAALDHVSQAAQALEQASANLRGDQGHHPSTLPLPDANDGDDHLVVPASDPQMPPTCHTAITPASSPCRTRRGAPQHANRTSLNQDRNPNRESESRFPPHGSVRTPAQRTEGDRTHIVSDGSAPCAPHNETVRTLVTESVYPGNVRRFADLPHTVVQAAAEATGLPLGHPHRAGRLIERLDAYRAGLWQPRSAVGSTDGEAQSLVSAGQSDRAQAAQHQATASDESTNNRDTLWTAVLADLARELSASELIPGSAIHGCWSSLRRVRWSERPTSSRATRSPPPLAGSLRVRCQNTAAN